MYMYFYELEYVLCSLQGSAFSTDPANAARGSPGRYMATPRFSCLHPQTGARDVTVLACDLEIARVMTFAMFHVSGAHHYAVYWIPGPHLFLVFCLSC